MHTKLQKIPNLAEFLGVSKPRAYHLASLKDFFPPGVIVRLGRQVRWNEEILRDFLNTGGILGAQEEKQGGDNVA